MIKFFKEKIVGNNGNKKQKGTLDIIGNCLVIENLTIHSKSNTYKFDNAKITLKLYCGLIVSGNKTFTFKFPLNDLTTKIKFSHIIKGDLKHEDEEYIYVTQNRILLHNIFQNLNDSIRKSKKKILSLSSLKMYKKMSECHEESFKIFEIRVNIIPYKYYFLRDKKNLTTFKMCFTKHDLYKFSKDVTYKINTDLMISFIITYTSFYKRSFFFNRLPTDIFVIIFQYMSLKDIRNTMVISKSFFNHVNENPLLWQDHVSTFNLLGNMEKLCVKGILSCDVLLSSPFRFFIFTKDILSVYKYLYILSTFVSYLSNLNTQSSLQFRHCKDMIDIVDVDMLKYKEEVKRIMKKLFKFLGDPNQNECEVHTKVVFFLVQNFLIFNEKKFKKNGKNKINENIMKDMSIIIKSAFNINVKLCTFTSVKELARLFFIYEYSCIFDMKVPVGIERLIQVLEIFCCHKSEVMISRVLDILFELKDRINEEMILGPSIIKIIQTCIHPKIIKYLSKCNELIKVITIQNEGIVCALLQRYVEVLDAKIIEKFVEEKKEVWILLNILTKNYSSYVNINIRLSIIRSKLLFLRNNQNAFEKLEKLNFLTEIVYFISKDNNYNIVMSLMEYYHIEDDNEVCKNVYIIVKKALENVKEGKLIFKMLEVTFNMKHDNKKLTQEVINTKKEMLNVKEKLEKRINMLEIELRNSNELIQQNTNEMETIKRLILRKM